MKDLPKIDPIKAQLNFVDKLHPPTKDQLRQSFLPTIPKQKPDLFAPIKRTDTDMIIRAFGIPFLQTEIYKGRIPIAQRDTPPINRKSELGTNLFSDLQFVSLGELKHIPIDCVLYDVKQSKNIVRTDIQGRDGSIKEYIGLGDYEISIKGVINGSNGVYPKDKVLNLVTFLRYEQSLGVISWYLNDVFDITEIVIKDYAFEQVEGSQSYQKFEILAYSDKPVEILIQEAK